MAIPGVAVAAADLVAKAVFPIAFGCLLVGHFGVMYFYYQCDFSNERVCRKFVTVQVICRRVSKAGTNDRWCEMMP